jgi:nucleotide-binding universal stress UspA family protein
MFDRIAVAVDGSTCSMRAVELAGALALTGGADVVVIHLAEVITAWTFAVEAETPVEATDLADHAVRTLKDRGVSARAEVRACARGTVAPSIVEAARDADAELIVMGSRGLGDFAGLLLGSVAHKVLHLSEVPVLIAK